MESEIRAYLAQRARNSRIAYGGVPGVRGAGAAPIGTFLTAMSKVLNRWVGVAWRWWWQGRPACPAYAP